MLTPKLTNFLDAIAGVIANSTSYIEGDAGEINEYLATKIAEKQAAITTKATVNDFVDSAENLLKAGADAFANEKVKALLYALAEITDDAQNARFFELFPDGIELMKAIKKLKKSEGQ